MTRIAGQLLILLALLMMPVSMAAAGATAPSAGHDAAMAMEHCPDSAPAADHKSGIAACTMVCAAALPAIDAGATESPGIAGMPLQSLTMKMLVGVLPDIATPPPRRT